MTTDVPRPPELRRLQLATAIFAALVIGGVVGYRVLMDMTFIEALYMTVITVTTVGFSEVVPLSDAGRLFTIGLIVGGVSTVSYAALTAAEFVVEGHLGSYIERRRMARSIGSLRGHVIICGYGRVGRHLGDALGRADVPFVVIDDDPDKLDELEELGLLFVDGDASAEHTLVAAGIEDARAVVACVNTDADNVLITLTAKGLRPGLQVVGRAKLDENEQKLRRAGADRVILPSSIGARRIASLITRPAVAEFLEGLGGGATELTLEEVPVLRGSALEGGTLRDAGIRERWGVTVLAIRHPDARIDKHPDPSLELVEGDVLVVFGGEDEVRSMRLHFV